MTQELENAETSSANYSRFRLLPLIIEFIPVLILLLAFLIDSPQLKTVGFLGGTIIYVFLGWYLFKSNKYKVWDILFASFFGLIISIVLIGILFYVNNLPNGKEMLMIGHLTLNYGLIFSLVYMIVKYSISKNKKYEFTMSQKIFSRFLLLFILFYSLGLNSQLESLL